MPVNAVAGPDVAEIAASSLAPPRRAEHVLTALRRLVPLDGAWPASADPTLTFATSPKQTRDIEATGSDRALPPHLPVDVLTPTRTRAAVRAERAGRYVPCVPGLARRRAQ